MAKTIPVCPKCKTADCPRWNAEQKMSSHLPYWKLKLYEGECAFRVNACPACRGLCCRNTDFGNPVLHMGAEVYTHECDYCVDGQKAKPDPRDELLATVTELCKKWSSPRHEQYCEDGPYLDPCVCGANDSERARLELRKLLKIES